MTTPLSLYRLGGTLDAYQDVTGATFDADAYSRMKHGDIPATAAFGQLLAKTILTEHPEVATDPRSVLLPVAYRHVPPACYHLAAVVAEVLTHARAPHGLSAARIVKIEKDSVTNTDYATATPQARAAELNSLRFTLTEPVTDAHLVLVDDVRITGASEAAVAQALLDAGHHQLITAYIATLDDSLAAFPQIESVINHASVKGIRDMEGQVRRGDFALTIRFLKRALASPDLGAFLGVCDYQLRVQMLDGALRSGDTFQDSYVQGIATLHKAVAAAEVVHV